MAEASQGNREKKLISGSKSTIWSDDELKLT